MNNTDESFSFLKKPVRLSEQKWSNSVKPFLTISCITFNHENFIKDTIEGFLKQETTFPVEIIVHDDASTDNTPEILKEYEAAFPQLFKIIYQSENQYSKGVKMGPFIQYPRAQGKYYSSCEGDDYWLDVLKCQKQIEFLERNQDYSMTCGGYIELRDGIKYEKLIRIGSDNGFSFSLEDLNKVWLTKTLTVTLRTHILKDNLKQFQDFLYFRDSHLIYFLLKTGKGYYFTDLLGVFNVHHGGVNSMKELDHKYNVAFNVRRELFYYCPDLYNANLYLRKSSRLFVWNIRNKKFGSVFYLFKEIFVCAIKLGVLKVFK